MPHSDFFTRFGIFAVKRFLDAELCARLRAEMFSSELSPAMLVEKYGSVETVKESVRKTGHAKVSESTTSLVVERLMALRPEIENHFKLTFNDCEDPQFLIYNKGDFFLPHRDREDEAQKPEYIKKRKVSLVIFLNEESEEPAHNTYCGGGLAFYGLIDDPGWEKYGFQLKGETGLLVAFRSSTLHEVTTVTYGTRCSIVSWLY